MSNDAVNNPKHYTSHPSGVECITIVEVMTFCVGNVIKYCWRAGLKEEQGFTSKLAKHIEDLKKARWYLDREIKRLEAQCTTTSTSASPTSSKSVAKSRRR